MRFFFCRSPGTPAPHRHNNRIVGIEPQGYVVTHGERYRTGKILLQCAGCHDSFLLHGMIIAPETLAALEPPIVEPATVTVTAQGTGYPEAPAMARDAETGIYHGLTRKETA